MDKNVIKFHDSETKNYKHHQNKSPLSINNIDINKIVVSNNLPFSKQDFIHFTGYKDVKRIRPLCIFFLKVSAYRIDFDENEYMHFMIKEKKKTFNKFTEI